MANLAADWAIVMAILAMLNWNSASIYDDISLAEAKFEPATYRDRIITLPAQLPAYTHHDVGFFAYIK